MDIFNFLLSLPESIVNRQATEIQILDKFLNRTNQELIRKFILTRIEDGKDANKSQSLRQVGNEYYAKQDYVSAMVRYNESLEFAPPDSLEYATALASRSTVLFDLKRYKDCLVDNSRVLRSKYPKLLMYRVYIQQAKCFMELRSYNAVTRVLQNFKQWLQGERGNLSTKNIEYMAEHIRDIQETLKNKYETLFAYELEVTLPVVTAGDNQKFASASKTMVKNVQGVGGMHVLANSDVKKGDILFVEEPYSTSCTSTHSGYFTYCNQCFVSSLTCIPCKFCTEIYFCTEKCRGDYWNLRHKWECLAIRKRLLSTECSLALGIFFRAARTGFKSIAKSDDCHGNEEENFPYVNLLTHKMEMAEWNLIYKTKEAALMLVYLIEYTDYINWLYAQENCPKVSRVAVYKLFGDILLKILLQISSNSETVLHSFVMFEDKFSPGLNYHNIALGLYVSSCLMNHSCLPNAMRSFHGCTKVVRALTDIKKGTEITICYLRDPDINSHKSRESILLEKYLFTCSCRACTNPNWLYPWLCLECKGEALTTSNNRTANCRDCNHTFSLDTYMEKEIRAHAWVRGVCGSYNLELSTLQTSLDIIQQLYHKNNYKFMYWYSLIVDSCNRAGDFEKSLQYVTEMAQLQRVISGNNACTANMNMELKRVNGFVNCCLSLDDKTTENYKPALQDAKDGVDNCCDMLKYYMSSELVQCYKQNMWKILSAGDLNYDQTVQLYHFNSIPFSTNGKVQTSYITNPSYNSFKQ